jgi:hypothetical protein
MDLSCVDHPFRDTCIMQMLRWNSILALLENQSSALRDNRYSVVFYIMPLTTTIGNAIFIMQHQLISPALFPLILSLYAV